MSERYKQKEYELRTMMDNINSITYVFEDYVKETNYVIDTLSEETKEIITLRNIIKDIKNQLDYLETYSSKEDVFEDMKRRLDRIEKIIGDSSNE